MARNEFSSRWKRWKVGHSDLVGGIIETSDGEYEVSRFIGCSKDIEQVRSELRLMASAPRLLEVAVQLERLCEEEPPCVNGALNQQGLRWQAVIAELRNAIAEATDRRRPNVPN